MIDKIEIYKDGENWVGKVCYDSGGYAMIQRQCIYQTLRFCEKHVRLLNCATIETSTQMIQKLKK